MVPTLSYSPGAALMPPATPPASKPGEIIRLWRTSLNMRQEDLANEAEVSQKLISEIERGEQDLLAAGLGRIRNIVRALGRTLNELQEETGIDLAVTPLQEMLMDSSREYPRGTLHRRVNRASFSKSDKKSDNDILPKELRNMIDHNSARYPQLLDKNIQSVLSAPAILEDNKLKTEEDWFEYWLITKTWYAGSNREEK